MQASSGTARSATPRKPLEYKWIVAMVVIFGAFMSILDQTIVNIAIPRLQAAFTARGADPLAAHASAMQVVIRLVQRQGYMLALQDAFWLTLIIVGAAIVATIFVRMKKQPVVSTPNEPDADAQEAARIEGMLGA